jgi:hypothetical protein
LIGDFVRSWCFLLLTELENPQKQTISLYCSSELDLSLSLLFVEVQNEDVTENENELEIFMRCFKASK